MLPSADKCCGDVKSIFQEGLASADCGKTSANKYKEDRQLSKQPRLQ